MRAPLFTRCPRLFGHVLFAIFALLVFSATTIAQDLPPTAANMQSIPAGSYVIPMDNVLQSEGTEPFNVKAYGLANRLLQNSIPLKWAIKSGKSKDAFDFTATAKKISPTAGSAGSVSFAGGPFIIDQSNAAAALPIITAFNAALGANFKVAVYEITVPVSVDVRYTLTHKPLISVGSVNDTIHTDLFDYALIPDYVSVSDTTVNPTSCTTLVTQPHTDSPAAISNIKAFVQTGGNFLAECKAVNTYENVVPLGQFQTSNAYEIANVDTPFTYPNGEMPFSQFIGALKAKPSGSEMDWKLAVGSSFINSTFLVAQNSGSDTDKFAATVSKLYNAGNGGVVMYLGGHDYGAGGSDIEFINGQRMILNAVFQPPTRPQACGIQTGFPLVYGYKSARMTNDVNNNNQINPGDQITWTVNYVNIGSVGVNNFQIADVLPAGVTFAGPLTVSFAGGTTTATANPTFTGVAPNQNLLGAGAFLAPNGRITVNIPVTINLSLIPPATLLNQTSASGTELSSTLVPSDNIDNTTIGTQGTIIPPPAGSVPQTQNPTIDPTAVPVVAAPTAAYASVSGYVLSPEGFGVSRAKVTVFNANTLESRTVFTNQFGIFTIPDLEVGNFYFLNVSHKRYQFPNNTGINLVDDVVGLRIMAETSGPVLVPRVPSKYDQFKLIP